MTDIAELDRLIEAVDAGTAEATDFHKHLGRNALNAISSYNGSLDAAKALHDALLPGWFYCLMDGCAEVRGDMEYGHQYIGKSEYTARAWLLAIIRAHRAQIGGQ